MDIPIKLYSDELRFTTIGPVELESYNVTRLDSNTIFIQNLSFINKSLSKIISSVSVNVRSTNKCFVLIDGEKKLDDLLPQSKVTMGGGFLLRIKIVYWILSK